MISAFLTRRDFLVGLSTLPYAVPLAEAYGANYARLAKLKRKYDPDNVFKSNQNIIPA